MSRFTNRRRARWERLDELLRRADGGGAVPLSVDELAELVRLYRQTTTDLAIARREFPNDPVSLLLNQLVARAYGIIYREPPTPLSRLRRFYARELPALYRAAWPYLVTAAALLLLPFLIMLVAVLRAPENARLIVSPGVLAEIKAGQTWFGSSAAESPFLSSEVFTNNVEVSFLALGGGIAAGVGTVLVLVYNGLAFGGVSGALIVYGLGDRLIGFVSPHGFLELSVVVAAGASGLMLGRALIWPGLQTRPEALAAAGARSARLLLGLLPFLGAAGLLEGFVSPRPFPWPIKLAIGLGAAAVMYGYLLGLPLPLAPSPARRGGTSGQSVSGSPSPRRGGGQGEG
jgi:uncharacterized membrane protein SpoIIM required for sporulation